MAVHVLGFSAARRLAPPPHVIVLAVVGAGRQQRTSPLLGGCFGVFHGIVPHTSIRLPQTPRLPKRAAPAFPFRLLGPPGVRASMGAPPPASGDPFIDLMTARFNVTPPPPPLPLPMAYTENGSPTFLSSGYPFLDFCFHAVPSTPSDRVVVLLQRAWEHDPLKALKLVCNLRGVGGTGMSDREGFYAATLWLHEHHSKPLALNARWLPAFGYFRDLLESLYRLLNGPDQTEKHPLQQLAHGL